MNNYNTNETTPRGFHNLRTMRSAHNLKLASFIQTIVGSVLLGAGAIVFTLRFFIDHYDATRALTIAGASIALSGILELTIATILRHVAQRQQAEEDQNRVEDLRFSN